MASGAGAEECAQKTHRDSGYHGAAMFRPLFVLSFLSLITATVVYVVGVFIMVAVLNPESRPKSHAFACSRVRWLSYDTRTSAP